MFDLTTKFRTQNVETGLTCTVPLFTMTGNPWYKHEFGMLDYTGAREPSYMDEGMHGTFIDDANSTLRDHML